MMLDSWLTARLARELDALLRGGRIDAMHADAAELVLFCYRRGAHAALHARLDSSAPALAAYPTRQPAQAAQRSGWLGHVSTLLRGSKIERVSCIPNDRVVVVEVSSRSAFGLPSRSRIVLELQPRKANALVLRPAREGAAWVVVAAYKQFAGSAARRIATGMPYVAPPAQRSHLDRAQFIIAARGALDERAWERLLRTYDAACTPPLAREVMARAAGGAADPARAALREWKRVRDEVAGALERMGDVFVWRDGSRVAACHLIELCWPEGEAAAEPSLNDLCARGLAEPAPGGSAGREHAAALRLQTMLARCEKETQRLSAALADVERADAWREDGNAIYAHLAAIQSGSSEFVSPQGRTVALDARLSPKENAAEFFRKYKKARSGAKAMRARLQALAHNREYWEQLLWELARSDVSAPEREALLADIAPLLGKKQRANAKRPAAPERRHDLGGGAVAYVGRSPKDNERLTFLVAGPDDFWFHARGVPGAHVIVKTAGKAALTHEQLRHAAALAASHSKAAGATGVEVDYTRRKHVRRRGCRTGLVWYTHAATLRVNG